MSRLPQHIGRRVNWSSPQEIEARILEHAFELLTAEQVSRLRCSLNASNFDLNDLRLLHVFEQDKGRRIRVRFRFVFEGEQEGGKPFRGNSITGNATAFISAHGTARFSDVTVEQPPQATRRKRLASPIHCEMKTARFSNVVRKAGRPAVHLLLSKPESDPVLQRALRAERVMTLHQPVAGTTADFGTVGFLGGGPQSQVLLFPKSLHAFAERNIIGINYGLLKEEQTASARNRTQSPKPRPKGGRSTPSRIVPFPKPTPEPDDAGDGDIGEIKRHVRQALAALAAGRQVVAYKLLKTIVET